MRKRLLALALAAMLAFSLAACGGAASSAPASSAPAPASTAPAPESEAAAGTVKVAALESAYGAALWQEVADAFTAQTGIAVELTIDKKIEDVIRPGINAGDFPDVVHLATGREAGMTETFIKDKGLEPLDDVLGLTIPGESTTVQDKILPGFLSSNLTMPYGDDVTYLLPMFYTNAGLFYNAGLFAEKGWDVPMTWPEMWELADTASAEGIALFCYPTPGYYDSLMFSLLNVIGGPEYFESAMRYDEEAWSGENAEKLYAIIEQLCANTERTVPANGNNENYLKNQQLILDNAALFMPNGDWVIGEMADAPRADGFEWGFTAVPAYEDGGDRYAVTWIEQCWMPAGAANKEAGKQFMAFLYSDEAAAIFGSHNAVQPVQAAIDGLSEERKPFYEIYSQGAKPALGGWAATQPIEGLTTYDVWFQPINSLVSGDKNIDQYKADILAASARFREALL